MRNLLSQIVEEGQRLRREEEKTATKYTDQILLHNVLSDVLEGKRNIELKRGTKINLPLALC